MDYGDVKPEGAFKQQRSSLRWRSEMDGVGTAEAKRGQRSDLLLCSDESRLTLGLWITLWTKKETGLPAFRMASTASSWLASLRSTPPTCQRNTGRSRAGSGGGKPRWKTHLHDAVTGLQGPVLPGGTVLQDVLDEDAPHHLAVVQPAAHPAAPDDADAQRPSGLSEEVHPGERDHDLHQM